METKKTPNRVSTKSVARKSGKMPETQDTYFVIPQAQVNLEFFLKRGNVQYTADQLVQEVFGEFGMRMTENEKVFSLLKALESLEMAMPFEFRCPDCDKPNPVAVEVAKVMEGKGEHLERFRISFDQYVFEFSRPEKVQHADGVNLASIGLYMMQWLSGHNQGPDFEFTKLPIGDIVKLATFFADKMFTLEFNIKAKCAFCEAEMQEDFAVGLQEVTDLFNNL